MRSRSTLRYIGINAERPTRWARKVTGGLRLSVKVPREITHESRLADCEPVLDRFLGEVDGLGKKLGALLVQLPGSFHFDTEVVDAFLARLTRHGNARIAHDDAWLERLRHRMTWWLTRARSVWCIFDNTAAFAATENALALKQALALTPREA